MITDDRIAADRVYRRLARNVARVEGRDNPHPDASLAYMRFEERRKASVATAAQLVLARIDELDAQVTAAVSKGEAAT